MKISKNVLILRIKKGIVERFISLDLHLDFVQFIHEPLSLDFFIFYGFSLYIMDSLIDD